METTADCGHRVTRPSDADRLPEGIALRSRPGSIWQLGHHRIGCGSAEDAAFVDAVLAGATPGAAVIDPPWHQRCPAPEAARRAAARFILTDNSWMHEVATTWGVPNLLLIWDCVSTDVRAGRRPLKQAKFCLFYGDPSAYNWRGDTWDRRLPRPARTTGCQLGEIFRMSIGALYRVGQPHQKPIDWIRRLIGCLSQGVVLDPYLGSGTTLIACEQLGRPCRGMDRDPAQVDLAVARWERWTDQWARLVTEHG